MTRHASIHVEYLDGIALIDATVDGKTAYAWIVMCCQQVSAFAWHAPGSCPECNRAQRH